MEPAQTQQCNTKESDYFIGDGTEGWKTVMQ